MGKRGPMQVLRTGGAYLAARHHSARKALVVIAGAGVIGVAALSTSLHPLVGLLLATTIVSAAAKTRRRVRRLSKDNHGEASVAERLRSLSDEYFLLNDVVLPGHLGNIDHVVIGPCGVVVIETKNVYGLVESHGNAG
jgi:hypothetical protein